MSSTSTSGHKQLLKLGSHQKATATYSTLRTGILKITPGDSKCKIYCRGPICRFCVVNDGPENIQAIRGLYSTWVTEEILAMARLQPAHFDQFDLIRSFQENKINSVVNLQEFGEHSFCGTGVGTSGFSYDPELLMRNGIYYYNFPMPDFHSCSAPRLLDIVKVVTYALTTGKVAIHCHAGHGRTGMVIAAVLMYRKGISPMEAVALVRSKRPKSVQSSEQVETLHRFKLLINNDGGCIIPPRKFLHISQYVQYNSRFISRSEARLYGNIPKVVYIAMKTLLLKFYESVSIDLRHENERCNFHCERGKLIENLKILLDPSEIEASLNREHLETTKSWYQDATEKGLSICCMEVYFEDMAGFREIIRFVDYFFHATFHQITYRDDLLAALEDGKSSGFNPNRGKNNRDWIFTFFFLLKCVAALPEQLHFAMARLISKWFLRSEGDFPMKLLHWIRL